MTSGDAAAGGGSVEAILRESAPRVLAALVRRYGGFADCEDAVQEALLAATVQWPREGVPANPGGWLSTVATRRLIEAVRGDSARRRRELRLALLDTQLDTQAEASAVDDSLALLALCCDPRLPVTSQVALTLRAVGGLTTPEIARAFLLPEATIAQRIVRAKRQLKKTGLGSRPGAKLDAERLAAVRHVLYLTFTEGSTPTSGPNLHRPDLTAEAIRLARQLPPDGESRGLLALMLLTESRRPARTAADGRLVPLAEQDRTLWRRDFIAEGTALVTEALATGKPGPFQLQAAIAAVHAEAASAADTDWPQILILYDLLTVVAAGPMVALNRAVAVAMVHGPHEALAQLETLATHPGLTTHHRLPAVRAHLLALAGDREAARAEFEAAARLALSGPERDYLLSRAG